MTKCEMLFHDIQVYGFAIDEIVLYLDTHPNDENALKAYDMYKQKFIELSREYSENCGPMTNDNVKTDSTWSWVDNPWPWHMGYQVREKGV